MCKNRILEYVDEFLLEYLNPVTVLLEYIDHIFVKSFQNATVA